MSDYKGFKNDEQSLSNMLTSNKKSVSPTSTKRLLKPSETSNRVTGEDLLPPESSTEVAMAATGRYWVGLVFESPVESLDIAGINFPKINEKIVPDPMQPGLNRREVVLGSVVQIEKRQFDLLRERIPRTVIRVSDRESDEPGTGSNVGDDHRRRRGRLITIPTAEDLADRRAKGKPAIPYHPSKSDEPAARYMFMRRCVQSHPERDTVYPQSLEKTGMEWAE